MDAMLFAAGLGTRLGPLTAETPKALVPIGDVPILERVARRLIEAGADRIIINTHHFAERIVDYVASRDGFGVEVLFSHEPDHPLETGGGLLAAAPLLRRDAPFFVHNADILSEIPLRELYDEHLADSPLATLATMTRPSSRQLLFDDIGLVGRVDRGKKLRIEVREAMGGVRERAFAGIHVISPEFLGMITESGVFSILEPYLRLAGEGNVIAPRDVDGYPWIDIGKPEQLAAAEAMVGKAPPDRRSRESGNPVSP